MPILPIFQVRNLGPVREATVQLHPLTILIGKNNTGKTYMAKAVYAAYKALEHSNGPVAPMMSTEEADELLGRLQTAGDARDVLPGSFREKAEDWIGSRLERAGASLSKRLAVYFDLHDLRELQRWEGDQALNVTVRTATSDFLFGLRSEVAGAKATVPLVPVYDLPESFITEAIALQGELLEDEREFRSGYRNRRVTTRLARFLWENHFLPSIGLVGAAYYLPAGRSGLMEAWTDVVRLRLQQDRDRLALTEREPAALGGIALDFMDNLIKYGQPRARRFPRFHRPEESRRVQSAARYLKELIQGDVDFSRGRAQIRALTYTQDGNSITLQRSSSMVAELAPLFSWIKNMLRPGDLILIDEPEAHMHPEAVLAVVETLVALAGAGVKVLCTTHSSEFLHKVSNSMLRASSQKAKDPNRANGIDIADIGVYRFERSQHSSCTEVRQLEIDPCWGIPEDEHVAVAERLSRETADLVESLG